MSKLPDYIETYSKKNKKGTRIYHYRRRAENGKIKSTAKFKSSSGRNDAVNRLLAVEPVLIRKQVKK